MTRFLSTAAEVLMVAACMVLIMFMGPADLTDFEIED